MILSLSTTNSHFAATVSTGSGDSEHDWRDSTERDPREQAESLTSKKCVCDWARLAP